MDMDKNRKPYERIESLQIVRQNNAIRTHHIKDKKQRTADVGYVGKETKRPTS